MKLLTNYDRVHHQTTELMRKSHRRTIDKSNPFPSNLSLLNENAWKTLLETCIKFGLPN